MTPVVLVFSEDAGVRQSLVMLLESAGFAAAGFASAASFVASACGRQEPVCLLIEHHVPGGTDGLALLDRVAASGVTARVVVMVDRFNAALIRRATAAGAMRVLVQPLIDDAVLEAVGQAVGTSGGHASWSGP